MSASGKFIAAAPWILIWLLSNLPASAQNHAGEQDLHFVEDASRLGVDFVHRHGAQGSYFMPEIFGAGIALLDIDGDGDMDLFAVESGDHGQTTAGTEIRAPEPGTPEAATKKKTHRLWRQGADGLFTEISAGAGLETRGYGMGVAVGDIDGDGLDDLFVSAYATNPGGDALYRNRGDGTFEDITVASGLLAQSPERDTGGWSTSALFFDFDGDQDRDLFVVRYLRYEPPLACSDQAGRPDYCGPGAFAPSQDQLWRNDGDGHFTEISEAAGLSQAGKGLGAAAADFDRDGRLDLYVANDGEPNRLWLQKTPGLFTDHALTWGAAVNTMGRPEASMGVALGDIDGDGLLDLFLSHLRGETNTLYRADPTLGFLDATTTSGLGGPSLAATGFGTLFADLDLDADLDLVITNGGVTRGARPVAGEIDLFRRDYGQKNLVFRGEGSRFAKTQAGDLTTLLSVGRGLVRGDIDDDGDIDIVQSAAGGRLHIFLNQLLPNDPGRRWLQVQVRGPGSDFASVHLEEAGARQTRLLTRGQSYLSSQDPRFFFGLGPETDPTAGDPSTSSTAGEPAASSRIDEVEIRWRDGRSHRFLDVPANRRLLVHIP